MATESAAKRDSGAQPRAFLQLPVRELGLKYVPAIPVDIGGMADTLSRLVIRVKQREQALQGLSKMFTIGGSTARAYNFLYGSGAADKKAAAAREASHAFLARDPSEIVSGLVRQLKQQHDELALIAVGGGDDLTKLALDDPKQWSIGWTTFPDVYTLGLPHLEEWAASLDVAQPDKATAAFFPTIARYATTFNQILLRRVPSSDVGTWRDLFGTAWTAALDAAAKAGLLYVIDLRIYETLQAQKVAGFPRFTPSTVTVLVQDAATKALTPELIRVAGGDNQPKIFSRQGSTTPSAWVYALQAAKVSVTVFGIWLGHVYQWHIVTAAMAMTMFANLSASHPVRKLLEPQSSYLIPFDDVLLLSWSLVAPPTSIATGWQFLELMDLYAKGRQFFDDDPTTTLEQFGLTESDFTSQEPWDQYPIVGHLLSIWNATGRYVNTCVDQAYRTDQDVQRDQELQNWIVESGNEDGGNVRGLPAMDSKDSLKRVLHSLIYRITAHGTGRLFRTGNPALAFVANFPPCLHDATIPDPTARFDTQALLRFLPRTGTIGSMLHFYLHLLGFHALCAVRADRGTGNRALFRRRCEQSGPDRAAPLHRRLHRALRAGNAADLAVAAQHRDVRSSRHRSGENGSAPIVGEKGVTTMNPGQFYKADQLVAGVHQAQGGIFDTFRAAHAFGRIYAGTFTATPAAKALSRAAHFQGTPVPVTARLSGTSGDPEKKALNVVAMATKFYLPNGTVTDLIAITALPAFFARTPDEFLAATEALTPDPETGQRDPAKLQAFLASHPNAARVFQAVRSQPALVSFAQVSYRPLHAYYFVNAAGTGRWARYHWEPEAGVAGQPLEDLAKQPHDYLYEELEGRLRAGPVAFRLELQLAQDGDPVDDPSAFWPDDRERVTVGRLELFRPITEGEIGDPVMMHDPTAVTDGIEVSPDDQIIAVRRGAYLVSVAERTGGWQRRSKSHPGLFRP